MFSFRQALRILAWMTLGAAAGLALAWSQTDRGGEWRELGVLPEPPERIVGATLWGVWIECGGGELHYFSAHNVRMGGWSERTPPMEPQEQQSVLLSHLKHRPGPIENEVESLEIMGWREGDLLYSKYALRADGSVLVWQDWPKAPNWQPLAVYPLAGALTALAAMAVLWFVQHPDRSRGIKNSQMKEAKI